MKGDVRKAMLEVIAELGEEKVQSRTVVNQTIRRLQARDLGDQQAILTCWHDLMRTGVLAWGYNGDNPDPPFAHLTEHGRRALENLARDPSNPDGYLAALRGVVAPGSVAGSYVAEAVATYNAGCFKASAVMVGAAAESLVLSLRHDLVTKLVALKKAAPKDLSDWRIKRVLDAMEGEFAGRVKAIPRGLDERFTTYWSAFTGHLRLARNDAGHPKSVDPVTLDVVHGSLLIFPELGKLIKELAAWVQSAAFV